MVACVSHWFRMIGKLMLGAASSVPVIAAGLPSVGGGWSAMTDEAESLPSEGAVKFESRV